MGDRLTARFDLHVVPLPVEEQRELGRYVGWGGEMASGSKGFPMLLNQWLKCFLTPRGSDPTDLRYGTVFSKLIGGQMSLADARDMVTVAIEQCNTQLFQFQSRDRTRTASERLASAQLLRFAEDPSAPGVHVYIEIKNQARERLVIGLPTTTGG